AADHGQFGRHRQDLGRRFAGVTPGSIRRTVTRKKTAGEALPPRNLLTGPASSGRLVRAPDSVPLLLSRTESQLEDFLMTHSWFHWLRSASARKRTAGSHRTCGLRRLFVPHLIFLEDRTVPSVLTVLNNADSGDGSLRAMMVVAQSGDTIVFDPSLM